MRCKEAKQWMNAGDGKLSPAIVQHIANCPSCARMAQTERSLNQLFSAIRSDEQVAPLAVFRERAEASAAQQSALETIMLHIKDQATSRPRLLAGATLAVAVFLFVTVVPFSFTHTAGYIISVEDTATEEQVTVEDVENAIETAEIKNVSVVVTRAGDINTYTISELPNLKTANRVALAIRGAVDSVVALRVEPTIRVTSEPIYAQVVRRVVKEKEKPHRIKLELGKLVVSEIDILEIINDFKVEDVEVAKIVKEKLIELGAPGEDLMVTSETDEDANARTIKLEVDADKAGDSGFEMAYCVFDPVDGQREYAIKSRSSNVVEVDSLGNTFIKGHTIIIKFSLKSEDD